MSTTDRDPRLDAFLAWLPTMGVSYRDDLIEFTALPAAAGSTSTQPHLAVFAKADVPADTDLAKVPKKATLGPRTCAIAALIEKHRLVGGAAVALAVMVERARNDPWVDVFFFFFFFFFFNNFFFFFFCL
jgi:hypothetical protein